MVELRFLAKDRDAMLDVRYVHVGDHAPLKPADQAGLEPGNLRGWAIARDDDLATSLIKRIEGVKELLLHGFLAFQEVNVVDQEKVGLAKAAAEVRGRAVLD